MTASSLINYFIVSSLCLLTFYLFYIIFLKRQQHFNVNRAYLLISSALSLIIPLIEIQVSSEANMPIPQWEGYILLPPVEVASVTDTGSVLSSWQSLLLLVYITGCLVSLTMVGRQLYRILSFIRKNRTSIRYERGCYLIPTHGQLATSSFFNFLFWNDKVAISEEERKHIIAHERVHIAEKHSYDVLYFSLLKVFYWFNPFVYLYHKETTELHEYIADARVVARHDLKAYQSILARQAAFTRNLSLANHFYKSQILKRLKMMEHNKNKIAPYRILVAIPLLAMVFYVFSCQEENEMSKLDTLSEQYKNAKTDEERDALSDVNETFMVVEEQPEPEGGIQAFYKYVSENLKYPAAARQKGVEGKVFVQFVVDTDGSLTEVKAIKGIGSGCDEEAVRVLRESPAWNPGKQRGQLVKVRMVMPITFKLNEGNPKAEADNIKGDQGEMNVQINRQGNTVKGTVVSKDGNPVAGANVLIKGTTRGTVTDREGNFSLQLQGEEDEQELAISHMSYQHKQVKLL